MKVEIETKEWKGTYEVQNGFQAVKEFFKDVKRGKIKLSNVGLLGFWKRADGEKIPFRIPPALFAAGLIDLGTLAYSLDQIAPMTFEQTKKLIEADKWMVE